MSTELDLHAAWQGAREEYGELQDAMKPAIALLREYVESVGGCDHDVGICICGDKRILDDAERTIGLTPNVELTGDGQLYRPASSDRRERG